MKPVLISVVNAAPELLFISLRSQEGILLLQQMKEVPGAEGIALLNTATMFDDEDLKTLGDDAVGLYLTVPKPLIGTAVDQIAADYEATYNEARPSRDQFIFAYDAANLLLDAIEAVAVQEENGTLHIGRQALRDALYATTGYEGVSGCLTCNQYGDCAFAEFEIMHADNPAAGIEGAQAVYTYTSGE
jgi:branched-chain amino acid transport system substrate-binding protein